LTRQVYWYVQKVLDTNLNLCFSYFHVPGVDEKSQFRKTIVDSVCNEFGSIAALLPSKTVAFEDVSSLQAFLVNFRELKILKSSMSRDWFIGEIALICGWFLILSDFAASDYDYLLLFEDDLWFNPSDHAGVKFLETALPKLPTNIDLCFLYSPEGNFSLYHEGLAINEIFCLDFSTWSTALTMISKDGAKKYLSYFNQVWIVALIHFLREI